MSISTHRREAYALHILYHRRRDGHADSLTGEAAQALAASDAVFATRRLTAVCPRAAACPFDQLAAQAIASDAQTVSVLVSGDVGFFSAAGRCASSSPQHGDVRLVCGLSSMQYFCAKFGVSL